MRGYKEELLSEMERLRKELYGTYRATKENGPSLNSQEIYNASVTLDKVIVKFLKEKYCLH